MNKEDIYLRIYTDEKEIANLNNDATRLNEIVKEKQQEIERLNNIINKAIDKIQYIIDYGFDYDGFNNAEDLKGLIDMLVQYAVESRNALKGEDKE